jgi:hypothetical protein
MHFRIGCTELVEFVFEVQYNLNCTFLQYGSSFNSAQIANSLK